MFETNEKKVNRLKLTDPASWYLPEQSGADITIASHEEIREMAKTMGLCKEKTMLSVWRGIFGTVENKNPSEIVKD